MNFLLALVEIALLCAVIVYDISLGYNHGHKLVDMPLNIFLLSVFLKIPEWLIGAAFTTTVFRIKYIRYMRRELKLQHKPVKVERSKKWWIRRAHLEGDVEVGAGKIFLTPTHHETLVGEGLGEILTKEEGQKRIKAYAVRRDNPIGDK